MFANVSSGILFGRMDKNLCRFFIAIITAALLISGCSKNNLKEAFKGSMEPLQGNKIISDYCQSCHTHKIFDRNEHVIGNSKLYGKNLYSRARECRICHFIEKDFWGYVTHITRYPSEAEQGVYEQFEKKLIQ